jgi:hypothetical protein
MQLSLFHRARRVHAGVVVLVHGDDKHELVGIMRSKSAERGADGTERRKRMRRSGTIDKGVHKFEESFQEGDRRGRRVGEGD